MLFRSRIPAEFLQRVRVGESAHAVFVFIGKNEAFTDAISKRWKEGLSGNEDGTSGPITRQNRAGIHTLSRNPQKRTDDFSSVLDFIGGRYWGRTSDPCRVKAVLYR